MEAMGKSVLSNQFVAGLVDKLKAKMVGRTGTFKELLAQAWFEEARLKNTTASPQPDHQTRKKFDSNQSQRGSGEAQHTEPAARQQKRAQGGFSCGVTGPENAPSVEEEPQSRLGERVVPPPHQRHPMYPCCNTTTAKNKT